MIIQGEVLELFLMFIGCLKDMKNKGITEIYSLGGRKNAFMSFCK